MIRITNMDGLIDIRFEASDDLTDIASVCRWTVDDLCELMHGLWANEKHVIECIEKQTPQKPHKATTRYDEFIRYECPVCGGFLIKNYPCKCGQMIDWSDTE